MGKDPGGGRKTKARMSASSEGSHATELADL